MEVSREFQCPGCKISLQMTDAWHARAMMHQGGGGYVALVSAHTTTCPACGKSMQIEDIVSGLYSSRSQATGKKYNTFADIIGIIFGIGFIVALWVGVSALLKSCS